MESHEHHTHGHRNVNESVAMGNNTISGDSMNEHEMAGHDMSSHDMSSHVMHGHDMSSHDMSGHDMSNHMSGHDMTDHHMTGHDMSGHDMSSHDMSGHDISGHDMSGHDMSSHDMSGHDMTGHHMDTHGHHHDDTVHLQAQHDHHQHSMTFHTRNDDYILFSDWKLSPGRVTFFACLALVLLAVMYQCIKMIRARLGRKCPNTQCKRYILSKNHIIQTAFYIVQFVIGYMLMLAVMTYNAWVMVAAIVGIGLGYFFFGWAEYEETVRLQPITMKSSARSRPFDCGSTGEQELLPLSKESSDVTVLTSNLACSCEDQEI